MPVCPTNEQGQDGVTEWDLGPPEAESKYQTCGSPRGRLLSGPTLFQVLGRPVGGNKISPLALILRSANLPGPTLGLPSPTTKKLSLGFKSATAPVISLKI